MIVKLTGLTNDKRIQAIKTYRALTGLGLKASKDAVDGLASYSLGYGSERRETPVIPVMIDIANTSDLDEYFTYEVVCDGGIDRALVLDLMFAALAHATPDFVTDPAFLAVKAAF